MKSAAGTEWMVEAGAHKTLRGVLESWARQAGWTLVWNSARDYAVGSSPEQADNAVFRMVGFWKRSISCWPGIRPAALCRRSPTRRTAIW